MKGELGAPTAGRLSSRLASSNRGRTFITRLLVTISLAAFLALASAETALTAYPPGPPRPTRATCSISTIVDRRVAVSCNAGKARAGKRYVIKVRRAIVARGKIPKSGRVLAVFTVPKLLTRGTKIAFVVEGKTIATVRV